MFSTGKICADCEKYISCDIADNAKVPVVPEFCNEFKDIDLKADGIHVEEVVKDKDICPYCEEEIKESFIPSLWGNIPAYRCEC